MQIEKFNPQETDEKTKKQKEVLEQTNVDLNQLKNQILSIKAREFLKWKENNPNYQKLWSKIKNNKKNYEQAQNSFINKLENNNWWEIELSWEEETIAILYINYLEENPTNPPKNFDDLYNRLEKKANSDNQQQN